jgi:hypothetical protein
MVNFADESVTNTNEEMGGPKREQILNGERNNELKLKWF